jgi:transposase InsO family protein
MRVMLNALHLKGVSRPWPPTATGSYAGRRSGIWKIWSPTYSITRCTERTTMPLIWTLHTYNGGDMRSATLEARLEDLAVLRSFSRPRVSNDTSYSEALLRTAK